MRNSAETLPSRFCTSSSHRTTSICKRFEQEARAASALNHPNIIIVYDIGRHGSTPFIAMELLEGRSLRQILEAGPLSERELLAFATQIADGLAKAHAAGIILKWTPFFRPGVKVVKQACSIKKRSREK